jgi:leucine dehydrogenase
MEHEGVFFEISGQGVLMGAFIWRTNRGQGCGGIRSREYPSARDWLRDGLRLATGMGRKNALAGLFWGGAKGVVAQPPSSELLLTPAVRNSLFADYGRFLTSLRGCYVAAEDSGDLHDRSTAASFSCQRTGVTVKDVDAVFSKTRHTTCISPSLGGSGNPSVITARGIVCAIQVPLFSPPLHQFAPFDPTPLARGAASDTPQAAAEWMGESIRGKLVAVQGCGQVGLPLCRYLAAEGARVIVSESSAERAAEVGDQLRQLGVELKIAPFGDNSIL